MVIMMQALGIIFCVYMFLRKFQGSFCDVFKGFLQDMHIISYDYFFAESKIKLLEFFFLIAFDGMDLLYVVRFGLIL